MTDGMEKIWNKEDLKKSYIADDGFVCILFIVTFIQFATYYKFGQNLTAIFIEELLLLAGCGYRIWKVRKYNDHIENGRMVYADYDEVKSYYTMGRVVGRGGGNLRILHVYCKADGNTYMGRVELGDNDQYYDSVIEEMKNHKIPVIADDKGKGRVFAYEFVAEYALFKGWIRQKRREEILSIGTVLYRYIFLLCCAIGGELLAICSIILFEIWFIKSSH